MLRKSLFALAAALVAVPVLGMIAFSMGYGLDMTISPGAMMTQVSYTTTEDGRRLSASGQDITPLPRSQVEALAAETLTKEEAQIILRKGTEAPFCGNLLDNKKEGTYCCRLCKLPLFESGSKFTSGTGWPSFFQPVDPAHIATETDNKLFMERTEILCARCDGHLGHVFEDGPKPTGLRFCVNSASLEFVDEGTPFPTGTVAMKTETAYFGGGCFWGVEDRFQQVPGVIDAVSGYMGGHIENPTYKQVCFTDSGHAEVVRVSYDPAKVSFGELLEWFFRFHNPTQVNRQGPDIGTQYRSSIFPANESQRIEAEAFIKRVDAEGRFKRPVATTVEPTAPFYEAEEYHQDYHAKHGGSCALPDFE